MMPTVKKGIGDERGMSLVELLVSMLILGLVVGAVYGVMFSVQRGYETQSDRSINVEQTSLAMQQLNRELLSAQAASVATWSASSGFALAPAPASSPWVGSGNALIAYTQANAPTRGGTGPTPSASPVATSGFSCVLWRVRSDPTGTDYLEVKRWALNWAQSPSTLIQPWRTVASASQLSASFRMFSAAQVAANPYKNWGGRVVEASLTTNEAPNGSTQTKALRSTRQFTGRNLQFGAPIAQCSKDMAEVSAT